MNDYYELRPTNVSVIRYSYGKFYVDIIEYADGRQEAFLAHKDYGISMGMFAITHGGTHREFTDLVEKALPEYVTEYAERYMDEDDDFFKEEEDE